MLQLSIDNCEKESQQRFILCYLDDRLGALSKDTWWVGKRVSPKAARESRIHKYLLHTWTDFILRKVYKVNSGILEVILRLIHKCMDLANSQI